MFKKYFAAISDTDILIHLAKAGHIKILNFLFEKIYIPKYIYEVELKRKAGSYLNIILNEIHSVGSIFEVIDREENHLVNSVARPIILEKKMLVGKGESECAGYAAAMGISIIVSDNYTEFKYLDEYIMLTYSDILSLCVYFKLINFDAAQKIYNEINEILDFSSGKSFEKKHDEFTNKINNNGWNKVLGV